MKIKKGDKVQVITGKDKGVTGEVIAVFPEKNQVVVEGVNMKTKHVKPSQVNPDGGRVTSECPIDASNVMIYDTKAKVAGRVGYVIENGEKVRINKKSGNKIKATKK